MGRDGGKCLSTSGCKEFFIYVKLSEAPYHLFSLCLNNFFLLFCLIIFKRGC